MITIVLSTAPIDPSDVINYTNSNRIMKYCRQDGLILKADRRITMFSMLISDRARRNENKPKECIQLNQQ